MPKSEKNYRQLSEELNKIIDWFESGEVELDSAISKYEEAMKLIDSMQEYLKTADNKIKKLTKN